MDCVNCHTGDLVAREVELAGEFRKEPISIRMNGLECPVCGYKTIEGSDVAEYMRRVADEYRVRHGLLTSEDIRARRAQLGMTQEEFAQYLNVGIATVKRWELGDVQNAAMNDLIRLRTEPDFANDNSQALETRLASRSGLSLGRKAGRSGAVPHSKDREIVPEALNGCWVLEELVLWPAKANWPSPSPKWLQVGEHTSEIDIEHPECPMPCQLSGNLM